MRANFGLAQECDYSEPFAPRPACITGPQPKVLVWGDSIAMMMVSGMVGAQDDAPQLVQATRSACGPVPGIAPNLSKSVSDASAQECLRFNDSVLEYVLASDTITHVVLSGLFGLFLPDGVDASEYDPRATPGLDQAVLALATTVDRLRAAGKKVVIIAPLPATGADMGLCNQRRLSGRLVLGQAPDCSFDRADVDHYRISVVRFLREVSRRSDVIVLEPGDLLCNESRCVTQLAGVPIYRDPRHFNYEGSVLFARAFDLNRRIMDAAR